MESFRSNLQRDYENKKIRNLQEAIRDSFRSYFIEKGYLTHNSIPIISQEDKTVMFTSSSTNVIKPTVISGDYPLVGFIVSQECLRNHALKYAFNNNWLPFGQAYFNISSILSKPGRFSEVFKEALEYTTKHLEVNPADIIIRSTNKLDKLKDIDKHTNLKVEYDTKNKKYYQWNYGIPNVHGEGLTISIKNTSENSYLDVGNIVRFIDNKNNERGIEFGYGHEFLLSSLVGAKNPLALSQIFELFPFNSDLSSKYYGYLEVIGRIKKAKSENIRVNKSARRTYKKYLESAKYMGDSLGKDTKTIISELSKFCEYISCPTDFKLEKRRLDEFIDKKV